MRLAIIGSRKRTDPETVFAYVRQLPKGTVIVSGGADGPDTWASEAAAERGLECVVHRPDLTGVRSRGEASRRYHERNQRIIDDCDEVLALVDQSRKGGTEDAIKRAVKAGKPVTIK
jgi:hypothetical protein